MTGFQRKKDIFGGGEARVPVKEVKLGDLLGNHGFEKTDRF